MTSFASRSEVLDFIQKVRHEFLRRVRDGTASRSEYARIIGSSLIRVGNPDPGKDVDGG
ncbi:MAG: hypothetical protein M0Q92_09525 [Methanoregula sp.]|jgi:hypothetical protein|nr:hypothetical protein [Methanoregula sp.]